MLESLTSCATAQQLDALRAYVDARNARGHTYHHIDFGKGIVLHGEYDLGPVVSHFRLETRMEGARVLDVGTAGGRLALEAASRGATVVAIDLYEHTPLMEFAYILNLPISYRQQSVYELTPDDGPFDIITCGSVLLHLTDPIRALEAIRQVCSGSTHVTTACPRSWFKNRMGVCEFFGERGGVDGHYTYWKVSGRALGKMAIVAGFSAVTSPQYFPLIERQGTRRIVHPHVSIVAWV